MPRFLFQKLVRDRIADSQVESGAVPEVKTLSREAHVAAIISKCYEELGELNGARNNDQRIEELGDLQQLIHDYQKIHGISADQVEAKRLEKVAKSGGFAAGIYIEAVATHEDDKWTEYFRDNPERYPET